MKPTASPPRRPVGSPPHPPFQAEEPAPAGKVAALRTPGQSRTYPGRGGLDKTGRADVEVGVLVVVGHGGCSRRRHGHVPSTDPRMTTRAWDMAWRGGKCTVALRHHQCRGARVSGAGFARAAGWNAGRRDVEIVGFGRGWTWLVAVGCGRVVRGRRRGRAMFQGGLSISEAKRGNRRHRPGLVAIAAIRASIPRFIPNLNKHRVR